MKHLFKHQAFHIFLLTHFIIFIFLFLTFITQTHSLIFLLYVCIFIFCGISYYCLYCVCQQITLHAQLEAQNILIQKQKERQEEYLIISQENMDSINKARDEIYKKINSYSHIDLQNEQEAKEFAKQLIEEYAFLYQTDYCSNKIIDAILYNKLTLAKKYRIQTSVQVIVPHQININPIDIMSVYTNLLDNAIEACLNLDEENRFIDISSMVKSNYLIIKIINSKSPHIHIDINHMETSKSDKDNHGLGTQIIKKTCQANNGLFKIMDTGNTLEAYVTLQINKEK